MIKLTREQQEQSLELLRDEANSRGLSLYTDNVYFMKYEDGKIIDDVGVDVGIHRTGVPRVCMAWVYLRWNETLEYITPKDQEQKHSQILEFTEFDDLFNHIHKFT